MKQQNILQRGQPAKKQFICKTKCIFILKYKTYSNCRSSKPSPLSRILMIVISEIENCSIIPHRRANKSQQKTGKKRRGGEDANIKLCRQKKLKKSKSVQNYSREPSNSTAKTWKRLVKFSQQWVLCIPGRSILAFSLVSCIHLEPCVY